MLVLDRGVGGRIYIGEEVVIYLVDIIGKHAKVGIQAPESWKILREEHVKEVPIQKKK